MAGEPTKRNRPWKLNKQDLLRLEQNRVLRNFILAVFGGMFGMWVMVDIWMVSDLIHPITGGVYWPMVSMLAVMIAMQLAFLVPFIAVPAKAQRFIERVWRYRHGTRRVNPEGLVWLWWWPIVVWIGVMLLEVGLEFDINGVQPPRMSLVLLGGALIALGLFRRVGRRIACARCNYPRTRSANCPECGREAIDDRDWKLGERRRSPLLIVAGITVFALGVLLWRM